MVGSQSRTIAIVPAAGFGKRLAVRAKKPFVLLGGKPLVSYAIAKLDASPEIDDIIIAAERSCVKRLRALTRRYRFKKILDIIAGGKTRFESVRNCLDRIGPHYDIVLIHDAARPFLDERLIRSSIGLARRFGACIAAVAETDTIKSTTKDLYIKETLDRKNIFRAQTPQAFRYGLIKKAYSIDAACPGRLATDDASLVEMLGVKVKILKGSGRNIKITTKEDLKIAEVLI